MNAALRDHARNFALASMLTAYPDAELEETLEELASALALRPALSPLLAAFGTERGAALEGRYVDLFDRGSGRTSLYETEYGRMRGMSKGAALADIAGFYRAFGLELDRDTAHEMLDHVAVELEFYAMLLAKQAFVAEAGDDEGQQIIEEARRKFLADHLGSFVHAIAERSDVGADPVYGPVFAWCSALIKAECAALGVNPAPLDYFADADLDGEAKCGSLPVVD